MVIGVHIQEKNSPLSASVKRIAEKYADHRFILFCADMPEKIRHCTTVIISPKPKNNLLLLYWYKYKLPALLKKYSVEAFISDAGMLNAKATVPQYLFLTNTDFEENKRSNFRKIFSRSLEKAVGIFVTEDFIATALKEKYEVSSAKLNTVYHGMEGTSAEHQSISGDQLRDTFTDGYEYYFHPFSTASKTQLLTVLKAFSQLKKWQKSSLKLVLLPDAVSETELIPDFKNYKYREEVKIIDPTQANAGKLLRHAFAVVWLSEYRSQAEVLEAMQQHIPVIVADNQINKSLFGNAVIYGSTTDAGLAEKMQLIYKDESQKTMLAANSKNILQKYDAEKAAQDLLDVILNKTVIPLKKVTS